MSFDFILPFIVSSLPSVVGVVSPKITEGVKKAANAVAGYTVKLPAPAKVFINAAVTAVLAGVAGSAFGVPMETSLGVGAGTGLASSAGFAAGKKS